MKLVHKTTGKEVQVGADISYTHNGAPSRFVVGEIVQPSPENPKGMVKSRPSGSTWLQYYPFVLNCVWQCECGLKHDELPERQ